MNKIKQSEARIMVYISQVDETKCYATGISAKLNIDYNYLLRILNGMKDKKWLKATRNFNRVYYKLNQIAPIKQAKLIL